MLEEGDTTSIQNAPSSLSKSFDNIFSVFDFVDSIKNSVLDVYKILTKVDTAPTFSMNFNTKYFSGTYTIIDLSWYAPYKEYGDNVICMFIYLSFIWHIFKHASAIITGQSTASTSNTETSVQRENS